MPSIDGQNFTFGEGHIPKEPPVVKKSVYELAQKILQDAANGKGTVVDEEMYNKLASHLPLAEREPAEDRLGSDYEKAKAILKAGREESRLADREARSRTVDLAYVITDCDWSDDTRPQLEIFFCDSSGNISVRLKVAVGESHEDSIALTEGDELEAVKDILAGYIDIFTKGLASLNWAPQ